MRTLIACLILAALLAGCAGAETEAVEPTQAEPTSGTGMGMGMGMRGGMMARHHAQIPAEYAGLSNPVTADEESIQRGAAIYAAQCASCHGDGGMGDGPAGAALDPAPAPIAHSSLMMGDDYLFWRISEGGGVFGTAMIGWKDALDENSRWDVINYVQALGSGKAAPVSQLGGELYDPQAQATQQAQVLAQAVAAGVVTQAEADTFAKVHDAMQQYRSAHPEVKDSGASSTTEREDAMLKALVQSGVVTQAEAEAFRLIHDRLGEAGYMP
jgi:mono/diheme cytochrome c family protein